jgi:tetratricopeptide (TPR) repeat protein
LLGEFEKTDKYINNIVYDIDEKNNLTKTSLINYLRIRNEVLKVKMLELQDPDNNIKEIISHLDGLFNQTKNTKEDFAICVGIKMLSLQSKEIFTFEESIKLIQDMLNILKRETLFGKSHKNILEQYLYLSGLLGYYNSINSDFDGVMKASKKIDKYLADVSDIIKSNKNSDSKDSKGENIQYNDLFFQYSYFNTILKSSVNNLNENSSLQQNNINIKDVQKKISKKSDIDILNICVLEKDDLSKSSQFQHVEELFNEWTGQNIQIKDDKILLIYFYLYNKISNLTKKIVERMGIGDFPSKEKILEIRDFVTKIIDKTKKIIMEYNNESLKKIFKLPFFKNLFNRFYYVKIYSYYLEGKYRECLNEYTKYDSKSKIEYELQTQQSNEYMKKIEADCYFKLGEHKRAEELYDKIIGMGTNDPLIYFNLGLTAYFNNNRSKAITALEKASGFYKKENNIKKAQKIEELIEKLQQGK